MRFQQIAALSALAALTTIASATTFSSDASTVTYTGYSVLSDAPTNGPAASTYDIGTGGVWASPISGSSWVSFNPNTAPGGSYAQTASFAPNGYYTYDLSFTSPANAFGSLTVLADDTVSVFLNGSRLLTGAPGPYPLCAAQQPNCITPYTFALSGVPGGTDSLEFVVHQAGSYATGLDFVGSVDTPEPGSLMLLGSGLLSGAGALSRRLRRR